MQQSTGRVPPYPSVEHERPDGIDFMVSQASSGISRAKASIATWYSIWPNFAFEKTWYPNREMRIHCIASDLPASMRSASGRGTGAVLSSGTVNPVPRPVEEQSGTEPHPNRFEGGNTECQNTGEQQANTEHPDDPIEDFVGEAVSFSIASSAHVSIYEVGSREGKMSREHVLLAEGSRFGTVGEPYLSRFLDDVFTDGGYTS